MGAVLSEAINLSLKVYNLRSEGCSRKCKSIIIEAYISPWWRIELISSDIISSKAFPYMTYFHLYLCNLRLQDVYNIFSNRGIRFSLKFLCSFRYEYIRVYSDLLNERQPSKILENLINVTTLPRSIYSILLHVMIHHILELVDSTSWDELHILFS